MSLPSRPQAVRWAHRPNKQGLRLNYLLCVAALSLSSPHSPSISYRIVPHLRIAIPAFTHSRRYCFLLTVTHSPHQPHTSSPLNDVTISRTNASNSTSKPLQNALLFRPGAEHPRHRPGRRCQPPQPPCQLPRPSSTDVSGSVPTLTLISTDNFQ
jgi:hypothetical protein